VVVRNDGLILGGDLPVGNQWIVFSFPVRCVVLGQGFNIRHWREGGWLVRLPGHLLGGVLFVVVLLLKRFKRIGHRVWLHILVWFRLVVSVRSIPRCGCVIVVTLSGVGGGVLVTLIYAEGVLVWRIFILVWRIFTLHGTRVTLGRRRRIHVILFRRFFLPAHRPWIPHWRRRGLFLAHRPWIPHWRRRGLFPAHRPWIPHRRRRGLFLPHWRGRGATWRRGFRLPCCGWSHRPPGHRPGIWPLSSSDARGRPRSCLLPLLLRCVVVRVRLPQEEEGEEER